MRKFLVLLLSLTALWLIGCDSTATDGQTEIDTAAFFPNEKDNYWKYSITDDGEIVDYMTFTVSTDPELLLVEGEQWLRVDFDSMDSNDYFAHKILDDDTDSVQFLAYASFTGGFPDEQDDFDESPRNVLIWDEYGMAVGDEWDCWDVTGLTPELWDYSGDMWEAVDFSLDAEVTAKEDFLYGSATLSAYKIEYTGTVTLDPVGDGTSTSAPWQQDLWFVPQFGIVKIQQYDLVNFNLVEAEVLALTDSNVPVPGN